MKKIFQVIALVSATLSVRAQQLFNAYLLVADNQAIHIYNTTQGSRYSSVTSWQRSRDPFKHPRAAEIEPIQMTQFPVGRIRTNEWAERQSSEKNPASQSAKLSPRSTRVIRSASDNEGDKKSSPGGSNTHGVRNVTHKKIMGPVANHGFELVVLHSSGPIEG